VSNYLPLDILCWVGDSTEFAGEVVKVCATGGSIVKGVLQLLGLYRVVDL